MGDNVQLVKMKQYTVDRLSQNGQAKANGNANGGFYFGFPATSTGVSGAGTGNGIAGSGATGAEYENLTLKQNGFIANKEYGDFDTNPSPTRADEAPSLPSQPPRQPPRSRPTSTKPAEKFIPEHDIEIPKDGSLHEFSIDDMSTFLRYMGVEERIVTHVYKKGLDGHKFSRLKDSDLEVLGMKNPIICHFRDKSIKDKGGKRKSLPFML